MLFRSLTSTQRRKLCVLINLREYCGEIERFFDEADFFWVDPKKGLGISALRTRASRRDDRKRSNRQTPCGSSPRIPAGCLAPLFLGRTPKKSLFFCAPKKPKKSACWRWAGPKKEGRAKGRGPRFSLSPVMASWQLALRWVSSSSTSRSSARWRPGPPEPRRCRGR